MFYNKISSQKCEDTRSNEELWALTTTGDKKAEESLVLKNTKLIIQIANKFNYPQFELSDLVNQGVIGLYVAIERYKPELGFKFTTYATPWIYNKISLYVKQNSRAARYPMPFINTSLKIKKYSNEFWKKFNYYPSVETISRDLNIKPARVEKLSSLFSPDLSLDQSISETIDQNLYETYLNDSDENLGEYKEKIEHLDAFVKKLPKNQRNFIELKYGLGGKKKMGFGKLAYENKMTLKQAKIFDKKINSRLLEFFNKKEIKEFS